LAGARLGCDKGVDPVRAGWVCLRDRVDGCRRVQHRRRQADVPDDGQARRFQRRLLLVVEDAGEEPPVQHLAAVLIGARPGGLPRRWLGHFRSSLRARSRSTATASAAAFYALTTALSAVPPAHAPAWAATVFFFWMVSTASGWTLNLPASQRSNPMHALDLATASGVSGPAAGTRSVSTASRCPATVNVSTPPPSSFMP